MKRVQASLPADSAGFTLIEITAALAILVMGILSILALYPVGLVATRRSEDLFIASKQAHEVFADLEAADNSNPPYVDSGTFEFQKKFHSDEFFYLYRIDDIGAVTVPGQTFTYPNNTYYVRLAVYRNDAYAGGSATSPNTPTGKAIETFRSFIAKE